MTREQAHHRALLSLMDTLEELCLGLAYGHHPERDWAELVESAFRQHRAELIDPEGHDVGEGPE